jgi:uncharacterized membrane protein YbhN (UPF0104 family)
MTEGAQNKLKSIASFAAKMLFTLVLMALLLHRISLHDIINHFRAIHAVTLVWVFSWLSMGFILSVWRWHLLITAIHPATRFMMTLRALALERFLNQAIPTTVSGDIGRALAVSTPDFSLSASFLSVIMDRFHALLGLSIFVLLLTIPLSHFVTSIVTLCMIALFALGFIAVGTFILYVPRSWIEYGISVLQRIFTKVHFESKHWQKLWDLRQAYSDKKIFLLISCLVLTIAVHLVQLRAFQLLAMELGALSLDYGTTVVLATPAFFLATMPISISGWGLREAGVIYLFAQIGIAADVAASASISFGLAYAALSMGCGAVYLVAKMLPRFNKKWVTVPLSS